jgi:short-subunit dehydrogenase
MAAHPARHLVTGAGSGIGRVLAERLLERDDEVLLVARSPERAHDLRVEHPGATVVVADLADTEQVESLAGSLPEALDSLVNAAGVVDLGPAAELSAAVWQEQLAVNLVAPALLTRIALPALRAARGTVVMVNSGAGLQAHPQWSAYAASKHGLRALADALRAEEQAHGVRVTSVYPGRTATPMQAKVHAQEGKPYDAASWIDPATVAEAILRVLDLPRDATVTDLTLRPSERGSGS